MEGWLSEAVEMRAKQAGILNELTLTFTPEIINSWKDMIKRWNRNKSGEPDPYEDPEQSRSFYVESGRRIVDRIRRCNI